MRQSPRKVRANSVTTGGNNKWRPRLFAGLALVTALAALGAAASPGLAEKADPKPTTKMQVITPAPMPPTNAWAAADAAIGRGIRFGVAVVQHQQEELLKAIAQVAEEQAAAQVASSSVSSSNSVPVYSGSDPGAFLTCVRGRESGGNYSINTGNGYYGAYQFLPSTWNNAAAHAGRDDLVGKLPSDVSPSDQDAVAQDLLAWQGTSPWAGGNYAC